MTKMIRVCVALAVTMAGLQTATGQGWVEIDDAGSLPEEAQPIVGCGPLQSIIGATAPVDPHDMYLIEITDPSAFSASTSSALNGGFADFNTQLWLFDVDGLGIAGNDVCPLGGGNQSCLVNLGPGALGLLTQPGPYFIAISGFDDDPQSGGGPIFNQFPNNEITGPDGPGGPFPIGGWGIPNDFGNYVITLTGADFVIPPSPFEPGTKHEPPAAPCGGCQECPDDDEGYAIDPVYLFSGEYYLEAADLRIPGRGLDFVWCRKYRSRFGPQSAQGNGWDFSYNIRIEPCGPHLNLFDGHTRSDLYIQQPGNTWTRPEFFRAFTQNVADGSFTLTFPDTGTWNFHPFDTSPQEGKLTSIVDRNGNVLNFEYDPNGRLTTIHDTLDTAGHDRDISIAYNGDGFIQSVTDFIGRQVVYDYYEDGDSGGSAGDLKSVTTPIVTGTPNGNDFPTGKTTVYTYTTGFADEQLNHDLLTITDPKGQTWLTNVYAHTIDLLDPRHTEDPADIHFDRVVRQYWGDQNPLTGDIVDVFYVPQFPDITNNFAVVEAIVNDRVGHVKEFFYDNGNRGVIERIYTGQANPDQATTETVNRPTGQLRATDPSFFETRYEYSDDSLPTRILHPNLNEDFHVYDETNTNRRSQGNMLHHQGLPGPLGGDQSQISEFFEYDDDFGGCCGTNFVTRHTDGRGNDTVHGYDTAGNRTQTTHRITSIVEDFEYNAFGQMTAHVLPDNGGGHRRRDEFTYYAFGPQTGYLQSVIVDAPGLGLTTGYTYDAVGNITQVTDPRGHNSNYVFNALNQVVRSISREVTTGSGVRYETDTFYDANDNVVRVDVQNKDDQGVLQANSHFSTIFEYEILNHLTTSCQEVGAITLGPTDLTCTSMPDAESIKTEYEYDPNRNQTLVRFGEATNGNQPANTVETRYDERDLVFQEILAPADSDKSTTQTDYDGNKNVIKLSQGLEGTPRVYEVEYDGFDRKTRCTDPMGNALTYEYDPNGNPVNERIDGELTDAPGDAGNIRLHEVDRFFDNMDRLTTSETAFFDTSTGTSLPGGQQPGKSITTIEYSDNSQVTRVVNDNSHQRLTAYDSINRIGVVTDAKSNTTTYTYDPNSNIVATTELEKSDQANPDEIFVRTDVFDGLDRMTSTTDSVGNVNQYGYGSRNNQTVTSDANNNETRIEYDGINRRITTTRDLDGDGADGDGDDITTAQIWDDTSRLITQTDQNGNATSYTYDALNRMTTETDADGTTHSHAYDAHHNKITKTDANGSVTTCSYDLNNRRNGKVIVPGTGVSIDTLLEFFSYDGRNRPVLLQDDDSLVTLEFDSLSRITRETLNGQSTQCEYDGIGNKIGTTYPGGRVIFCTFDELERMKTVHDGPDASAPILESFDYIGPKRETRREKGNGTRTDLEYDGITPNPTNDFGVRRIVRTTHRLISDGSIIDDRTYTWDRMYNKTQRKDVRAAGPQLTHDYAYDDLYRLSNTTATDSVAVILRNTGYDLDGVGNRTNLTGSPDPGSYVMNAGTPEPADADVNQYTTTPLDHRRYDKNGNLIEVYECLKGDLNGDADFTTADINLFVADQLAGGPPTCQNDLNGDTVLNGLDTQPFVTRLLGLNNASPLVVIQYDYRNQMVEYDNQDAGVRHTYAYDALGRRISKIVDADGVADQTRYYYDRMQVCEEQDGAAATQATYVYGTYIDDVIAMRRSSQDYFYHRDDLSSVMAVTNGVGAAVERYEYQDYGDPEFSDGAGAPIAGSSIGNPYLFTGRRFDPETGWYYYRTRHLDPKGGRFTTRDTIGIWSDAGNLGNGYTYVGNNPWTRVDPLGLMNKSELIEHVHKKSSPGHADYIKNMITGAAYEPHGASHADSCREPTSGVRGKKLFVGGLSWNHSSGGGGTPIDRDGDGLSNCRPPVVWGRLMGGEGGRPVVVGAPTSEPLTWPGVPTEDTLASAADGPMPQTREHILLARQVGVPSSTRGKKLYVGSLSWLHDESPDKTGRIKVQFPWVRANRKGDTASCWMRVAQSNAGANRGNYWLPEIDDEVLVWWRTKPADWTGWKCEANPINPGSTGTRTFFVDQTGVIRAGANGSATTVDKPIE